MYGEYVLNTEQEKKEKSLKSNFDFDWVGDKKKAERKKFQKVDHIQNLKPHTVRL